MEAAMVPEKNLNQAIGNLQALDLSMQTLISRTSPRTTFG